MAAVACLSKLEVDRDFCSIISDMLRFFRIGFVLYNDPDDCLGSAGDATGDAGEWLVIVSAPTDSGPYSQVTSQSFSQFSLFADSVFNPFFFFAHVLHDAFSNRAELVCVFRLPTIYRHEAQISSSLHS